MGGRSAFTLSQRILFSDRIPITTVLEKFSLLFEFVSRNANGVVQRNSLSCGEDAVCWNCSRFAVILYENIFRSKTHFHMDNAHSLKIEILQL